MTTDDDRTGDLFANLNDVHSDRGDLVIQPDPPPCPLCGKEMILADDGLECPRCSVPVEEPKPTKKRRKK